jgi:hypothetical protein
MGSDELRLFEELMDYSASIITEEDLAVGWRTTNPAFLRYEDPNPEEIAEPAIGIYGTLDDARNQIRAARRFADAVLKYPKG